MQARACRDRRRRDRNTLLALDPSLVILPLARGSVSNAKAKDRQAWTWNEQNERGSEMTSGLGSRKL
jgi:hypothetical protein